MPGRFQSALGHGGRTVLRTLLAARGLRLVRAADHHILPRDYNSPVPDIADIGPEVWDRRSPMAGIELDLTAQLEFLKRELAEHLAEFEAPRGGQWGSGVYYYDNGVYGPVDAEILYAFIRRFKPGRLVELGSGFSTLVASQAVARNESDGAPCQYDVFDPYPGEISGVTSSTGNVHAVRAQDVGTDVFRALGEGDILLVDTTHTVKMGGDVNAVILDALPLLAEGVLVHFHDIWLPWEYHPLLVAQMGFWAEQYLLQAYLAENPRWEVLVAAQALARERRDELERVIPSLRGSQAQPTNFWIRRRPG